MTDIFLNSACNRDMPYDPAWGLSLTAGEAALHTISRWQGYCPTPLLDLQQLAERLGVARVILKDESSRFGLGSFKALGGAYAVERLYRVLGGGKPTFACATDGNHGRSVAWGAQRLGCDCVVYLHAGVTAAREEAIQALGARIKRVQGNYDDSVRKVAEDATQRGWAIVSDTSWEGYEAVARDVMQGYSVMLHELEQQGAGLPTHVFVQGGVGGLAAAVLAHFWEMAGAQRPKLTIVEPDAAACLMASARAGEMTAVRGELDTIMAGLACGEPSLVAWRLLHAGADAFMTVSDCEAIESMRLLASMGVVAGESGAAGLAGALAVAQDADASSRLGIDRSSTVLLLNTEGATDPQLYQSLVAGKCQAQA